MWPFSKRRRPLPSHFFHSYTDYHSHILPGVDDGVKGLEATLAVLHYYETMGITSVVLTPHVNNDLYSDWGRVEAAYAQLLQHYSGNVQLTLSAEYMLDNGFLNRLEAGLHPIEKDMVLVETSYLNKPPNFEEMLYEVVMNNYTPVVAHPERYLYMDYKMYGKLKARDYLFQLNLLSLSGFYSLQVQKRALHLLEQGMYDLTGTDLHNLESFRKGMSQIRLSEKHKNLLWQLVHEKRDL